MTFDVRNDRLDATIRDALRWQADRAPELVAPFDQAMQDLARSLDGAAAARDPRRTWVLLAAAAMPVTLLVGTLAIGAGIIRLPWETVEPPPTQLDVVAPPFGYERVCRSELPAGRILDVQGDEGPMLTLSEDGTLVTVDPPTAEARAFATFSATITERRLTDRGIELVMEAITGTGLIPGCRDLYSAESRHFRARTSAGPISVSTGSFPGAYGAGPAIVHIMDPEEKAAIDELMTRLTDLASWLPAHAWAAEGPTRVEPDEWEISVGWYDSGQGPGDVINTPSGKVLNGSNPDFAAIRLPNGDAIDGEACMVASTAETQAFADAVETASHMEDFAWYVFSEDLTREYAITAFAVIPGEEPCAAPHFAPQETPPTPEPSPPPGDACDTVAAADVEGVLGSAVDLVPHPPISLLGIETPTCSFSTPFGDSGSRRVVAAIFPRDLSADEAATMATGLLGADITSETMGAAGRLWLSACWDRDCPPSLVAWSGSRLFMLSFDRNVIDGRAFVTLAEARGLASTMAAALAGSDPAT